MTGFSADFWRRALGVLALAAAVLVARVLIGAHSELGQAERGRGLHVRDHQVPGGG